MKGGHLGPYSNADCLRDEGGIESVSDVRSSIDDDDSSTKEAKKEKICNFMKRYLLVILLTCSIIIGLCMGIGLRGYNLTDREKMYLAFPGKSSNNNNNHKNNNYYYKL